MHSLFIDEETRWSIWQGIFSHHWQDRKLPAATDRAVEYGYFNWLQ